MPSNNCAVQDVAAGLSDRYFRRRRALVLFETITHFFYIRPGLKRCKARELTGVQDLGHLGFGDVEPLVRQNLLYQSIAATRELYLLCRLR